MQLSACPCCGHNNEQSADACASCGARRVGEPLARPDNLLPSYGHALACAACGAGLLLTFVAMTLAAWSAQRPLRFGFWDFASAAEAAAWRLRFVALPLAVAVAWASAAVARLVRREPSRFMGIKAARSGIAAAVCFVVAVALFVGVTVPSRIRQNELAKRAAIEAKAFAFQRCALEYKARFNTYPSDKSDQNFVEFLKAQAATDAATAELLKDLEKANYEAKADIAASLPAPGIKSRALRNSDTRVRPVALRVGASGADEMLPSEGITFTSYKLTLPGEDGIVGTDDDIVITESGVADAEAAAKTRAPRQTSTPTNSLRRAQ